MRRVREVVCDLLLLALLVAIAGCSSDRPKPSIYPLNLHWTVPTELDTDEPLAPEDLTGYRLTCRDAFGNPIPAPPLTREVQQTNLYVRPGTYSCDIEAQAQGQWSDPSNTVTKVIP